MDLLIDDFRVFPVDKIAKTFDEGIIALMAQKWETLYLDHDLGDIDPKKTGYGICCFLEKFPEYCPERVILVTANPVGRANMTLVLQKLGLKL